jgi:selenocysteine lyase/cysteine desulfurase
MNNRKPEAIAELEKSIYTALETYSNVHRGSGHNSMVSTYLYEKARTIVLQYLGLKKSKYVVIFCTSRRAKILKSLIKSSRYKCISSQVTGLPLGVTAIAVRKNALPGSTPFETGGGTTRLISRDWVIWARAPEKFEAGTPAIINVIAFARALQLSEYFGKDIFQDEAAEKQSVADILYHDELENYAGTQLLENLRKTIIGRGIGVPTKEGISPVIYLDNAASTPTFKPVLRSVFKTWSQSLQIHKKVIAEVRSICSDFLGAPLSEYEVIFTSNTTEAINLAAENLSRDSEKNIEPVVLNTILEHNTNDLPWRKLPGILLIRQDVDKEGFIDLKNLDNILCDYNQKGLHEKKRIRLVAMSGASNVLGVFNNIAEISRIAHKYGADLLVDAAQLVAHRKIDMKISGIDYLAFSGHKVYAPFGTGALIIRKDLLKFSQSEMDNIHSSGEENPGGIAALGKMLVLLKRIGLNLVQEEEQDLLKLLLLGMSQIPDLTIHGIKDPDSPRFTGRGAVVSFHLKDIISYKIAKELAVRRGICIRYGCHCAHLLVKYLLNVSPRLEQFQKLMLTLIPGVSLPGIVRVSPGIGNNKEDIDVFVKILNEIIRDHRFRGQSSFTVSDDATPPLSGSVVRKQMKEFTEAASQRVYAKL